MKVQVNLTIDKEILIRTKNYASSLGISVSELIENYLKDITKAIDSESLFEHMDKLKIPKIDENIDFKKQYDEERAEKYGFRGN